MKRVRAVMMTVSSLVIAMRMKRNRQNRKGKGKIARTTKIFNVLKAAGIKRGLCNCSLSSALRTLL